MLQLYVLKVLGFISSTYKFSYNSHYHILSGLGNHESKVYSQMYISIGTVLGRVSKKEKKKKTFPLSKVAIKFLTPSPSKSPKLG